MERRTWSYLLIVALVFVVGAKKRRKGISRSNSEGAGALHFVFGTGIYQEESKTIAESS